MFSVLVLLAQIGIALGCGDVVPPQDGRFAVVDAKGLPISMLERLPEPKNLISNPNLRKALGRVDVLDSILKQIPPNRRSCFASFRSNKNRGKDLFFQVVDVALSHQISVSGKDGQIGQDRSYGILCDKELLALIHPSGYQGIVLRHELGIMLANPKVLTAIKELVSASKEAVRINVFYQSSGMRCGTGNYFVQAEGVKEHAKQSFIVDGETMTALSQTFDHVAFQSRVEEKNKKFEAERKALEEGFIEATKTLSQKLGIKVQCRYIHLDSCKKGVETLDKLLSARPELLSRLTTKIQEIKLADRTWNDTPTSKIEIAYDVEEKALTEYFDRFYENEQTWMRLNAFVKEALEQYKLELGCEEVGLERCKKAVTELIAPLVAEKAFGPTLRGVLFRSENYERSDFKMIELKPEATLEEARQTIAKYELELDKKARKEAALKKAQTDLNLKYVVCYYGIEVCETGIKALTSLAAAGKLTQVEGASLRDYGESQASKNNEGKLNLDINVTESLEEITYVIDDELGLNDEKEED